MFYSVESFVSLAEKENKKISEIMLKDQVVDMQQSEESIYDTMKASFEVMRTSIKDGQSKHLHSITGFAGGISAKLKEVLSSGKPLCDKLFTKAIMYAIAVAESNACMGRVIAAPTAGSCGILPGLIFAVMEEKNINEEDAIMSLFTASAFGMVIATNATVSGAEGGCQAECGSASAMAAAAVVEMMGGTARMCANACAISMKSTLGLVCDSVAGLVEVPCIKRNATGATNALTAAQMALAGIESVIPADEVILTMRNVGRTIPQSLRETSEGGLAVTPTGRRIAKQLESIDDPYKNFKN